tara:strand:- start:223 stop:582 length:360 start_codon:yes stop_codon:yes gene_type:complete
MSDQLVLAKITIPIRMNKDGELEPLKEYMAMEIEEFNGVLEKPEDDFFVDKIYDLLDFSSNNNTSDEIDKIVYKGELKKRKKGGFNQTFKNKKKIHNRTSSRHKLKINLVELGADGSSP